MPSSNDHAVCQPWALPGRPFGFELSAAATRNPSRTVSGARGDDDVDTERVERGELLQPLSDVRVEELQRRFGLRRRSRHRGGTARVVRPIGAVTSWKPDEDADASSLKARLVAVQIEKIEHALGVSRGEYWSRSEVQKWCAELAAAVRKVVTQIHLVAPSVVGVSVPEAEARLKDLEDEIMRQLHQIGFRVGTPANEPGS